MTSIQSITLEVPADAGAQAFYDAAFGLGERLSLRHAQGPTSGFRGFTLSLVASQPATVDQLIDDALNAGAEPLKPVSKSFWGYGGVVRAPDGSIWKVATSSKKNDGPATRQIDQIVLLLGVQSVPASKDFYVEHGLTVGKRFFSKYVEFDLASSPIKLALYAHGALAKDAGVSPDGSGAHRIAVVSDAGSFTDPDGFAWEPAQALNGSHADAAISHAA